MKRRCLGCAVLIDRGSRCVPCARAYRGSGFESSRWRATVLAADGYRCRRCGLYDPTGRLLEADHIVPLAEGGHRLGAGQALCTACHRLKGHSAAEARGMAWA